MTAVSRSKETQLGGMIGTSPLMQDVYRLTRRVAGHTTTVLLTGETGTGKELVARAIHELSPRASGPFVRVSCGSLSEPLLESELFGHVQGAFPTAGENRPGRFEAADGGTILLDEIDSVSVPLQVKLLRVLQEQEFKRVGDTRTIRVDCRIVASTNRDLLEEIDTGRFREDLYYRLNVIEIRLPPLRERPGDISPLVAHFLEKHRSPAPSASAGGTDAGRERADPDPPLLTPEALGVLERYPWPGNVRELENCVERALVLKDSAALTPDSFPAHVRGLARPRQGRPDPGELDRLCGQLVSVGLALGEAGEAAGAHPRIVSLVERHVIRQVLAACQGVQTKAAARLGINRNTLHKKIAEYGLEDDVR